MLFPDDHLEKIDWLRSRDRWANYLLVKGRRPLFLPNAGGLHVPCDSIESLNGAILFSQGGPAP
jgi:hypothetical protein